MPDRELDTPRPAATVVLLRESSNTAPALEVLLLRRKSELAFYGGAWVFPGGAIDLADRAVAENDEHAARLAAVRELREEAGLSLASSELLHFAQWITPAGRSRRFDTWFFAAAHGDRVHEVQLDANEVDAFRWLPPSAALEARAAGEIELPPPTFVTLSLLAAHTSVASALDALRQTAVQRYAPLLLPHPDGTLVHLYQGDAGYDARDPLASGARHRLIVTNDDWRYER